MPSKLKDYYRGLFIVGLVIVGLVIVGLVLVGLVGSRLTAKA